MTTNGKVVALIGMLLVLVCGCMLSENAGLCQPQAPAAKPAPTTQPADTPALDPEAANAAVRKRLASKINKLEFDDVELKDALQYLRDVGGLNVHVKWSALSLASIDRTTPVNIHLSDITLEKALLVILDDVGGGSVALDYLINNGVITISTKEDVERHTVTRSYPAGDIVFQIWQAANADMTPWQRDPFDLHNRVQSTWPSTQPAPASPFAEEDDDVDSPLQSGEFGPIHSGKSRRSAWLALIELIVQEVEPRLWRWTGGEVGSIHYLNDDLVITQTQKGHDAVQALLAQLREKQARTIPLGLALVRVGDEDNAAALRQLAAGSKNLPQDLRDGMAQEKWGVERCEVEQARPGRPVVLRRIEHTMMEPAPAGPAPGGRAPGVVTVGYEAGILPLAEDKTGLRISAACCAGWIVPPPEEGPKPPLSTRCARRICETIVPPAGAALLQVAPMDAEGGALFLVLWREPAKP